MNPKYWYFLGLRFHDTHSPMHFCERLTFHKIFERYLLQLFFWYIRSKSRLIIVALVSLRSSQIFDLGVIFPLKHNCCKIFNFYIDVVSQQLYCYNFKAIILLFLRFQEIIRHQFLCHVFQNWFSFHAFKDRLSDITQYFSFVYYWANLISVQSFVIWFDWWRSCILVCYFSLVHGIC